MPGAARRQRPSWWAEPPWHCFAPTHQLPYPDGMKTPARTRRTGLYLRISDDREGAGLGVDRQEKDCRELAERLGWKIVEKYDDNDMSATNRRKKREGYARLLADIESGHVDAILAWHPDRLYRQPRELEDLIDLIEAHQVEIETYTARGLDLSTPTGKANARMLGVMAKYEVEHKQERIRRKVQELVEAGKIHNSGHRPFGYERIYEGEGPRRKIIEDRIDETEAKHVRDWANRALEGETLYSLVTDANGKGIKTSTGGAWSYQGMRFMLASGRIAGLKEHKRKIVGKAVWPAIISEEQHKDLRALLSDRAEQAKENGAQRNATAIKYPLSGLVRCTCAEDHIRMRTSPSSNRKGPVYRCPPKGDGGAAAGRSGSMTSNASWRSCCSPGSKMSSRWTRRTPTTLGRLWRPRWRSGSGAWGNSRRSCSTVTARPERSGRPSTP